METPSTWDRLTREHSPLADASWVRCFEDAFGGRAELRCVVRDGRLVAGVPLVRTAGLVRAWISQDNEHTPYLPIAGDLDVAGARDLLGDLLDDSECLFLRRLHVGSQACTSLREAARDLGLPVAFIQSDAGDARIDLQQHKLPRNFARDLPRKLRGLEQRGPLEFGVLTEPGPELGEALRASYHLETLGWKGTDGSPIARDPQTLQFYTELAQAMAARGRFALYTMTLAGRLIAFEYSLRGGGHIEMLKLSFDPDLARYSPGQVLRLKLLEREAALGEIRYYHLGRPSPWKLRWATEVAPLCTLRVYGDTVRARGAYVMGPALRAQLKRSAVVRRVVQRIAGRRDAAPLHR